MVVMVVMVHWQDCTLSMQMLSFSIWINFNINSLLAFDYDSFQSHSMREKKKEKNDGKKKLTDLVDGLELDESSSVCRVYIESRAQQNSPWVAYNGIYCCRFYRL